MLDEHGMPSLAKWRALIERQFEGAGVVHLWFVHGYQIAGIVEFPDGLLYHITRMVSAAEVQTYAPIWRKFIMDFRSGSLPGMEGPPPELFGQARTAE